MKLQKFVLYWAGLISLGLGIAYIFLSTSMLELSGMLIPTPAAKVDAWAIYGGLQIGFGLFLLICVRNEQTIKTALLSIILILGGVVTTRMVGVVYLQAFDQYSVSALLLEGFSTLLALWAFVRCKTLPVDS